MEEEGMGARPPISCYSTIRCMLMVMFGSAITIIIMIVLIINGCIRNTVDKFPGKLAWVDHMHRKWT